MSEAVAFSLDGREVAAAAGETIWQVAAREGVAIPHLCHSAEPGYRPDGNCRACMVEVEGGAGPRRLLHPPPGAGHEGADRHGARPALAPHRVRASPRRPAPARERP